MYCDKKTFNSEGEALKFAKRTARNNSSRRRQRAYYCDECHGWHLSSEKRLLKKKGKKKWKRKNKGTR